MPESSKLNLILTYGPDEYRKEAWINDEINKRVPKEAQAFNVNIFYGDDENPSEWIRTADTLPFLSDCRVVIIRHGEKLSKKSMETLVPYLKKPSKNSILILDSSIRKITGKDFEPIVSFFTQKPFMVRSPANWAFNYAKDNGYSLQSEAGEALALLVGNDVLSLKNHLDMLFLYKDEMDKTILDDDIEALFGSGVMVNIFTTMDAVTGLYPSEALRCLEHYLQGEGGSVEICLIFVRTLAWHLRRLFKAKELLIRGEDAKSVSRNLKIFYKDDDYFRMIQKRPLSWFQQSFHILFHLERALKGDPNAPMLLLERAILELFGKEVEPWIQSAS